MGKLIVGVGGTGTKIIRAIEQRWQRLGEEPSDVVLAVIDARERTPEEGEIPRVTFYPNKPVNFSDEYQRFREQVEPWWPANVRPSTAINFGEGCGAIRAYGRFFAFRFAKKIIRTIDEATETLIAKTPRNAGDARLAFSVIVVGSLGNGTGGGTLLDVATIARHTLSLHSDEVRCMGVFIPGAVTRKGNKGVLEQRVAASGFASLLELQYEFNRSDPAAALRPSEPYQFVAFDGIHFTEFRPGRFDDATPFDAAMVLDERDRNGRALAYPSLVQMAAEGVAMMIEGGDRDYRLVDSMAIISNGGAKRFGSFGAARLMVPGPELMRFAVASHTASCIEAAASADEKIWRELLADETPGDVNKKMLRPDDATIDSSVDFFIEHILRVKETGKGDAKQGALFNQMFDRFAAEDEAMLAEFDGITEDIDRLKDAKAVVNRAAQIGAFVEDRMPRLAAAREKALFDDDSSLWRRPRNPDAPELTGVKWLINDRVLEFVNAGAFGLLERWLDELRNEIAINAASIENYERQVWLADKSRKDIDITKSTAELAREAEGFFRNLRRTNLIKRVNMVRQDAQLKFEFRLWETKVDAVKSFYQLLDGHVEKLRTAAEAIRDAITSVEATGRLAATRDDAAHLLDDWIEDRVVAAVGVKAEIPLGGGKDMREALIGAIRQAPSARAAALLRDNGEAGRMFLKRISADAETLGFTSVANGPQAQMQPVRDFVASVESRVRDVIDPIVSAHCSVDSVLESNALALIDTYYDVRVKAAARMRGKAFQDAKDEIRKAAGEATLDLIEQLDWENDPEGARDKAIELVIAGRLNRYLKFATPQWSLSADAIRTSRVTTHQMLTYPAASTWIPRAIEILKKNNADDVVLKPQASQFGDPMRIDIVCIEVGADVDVLRMTSEFEAYKWGMQRERAFSPHLTQEYHDMGTKYLESTGDRVRQADVLLALSEIYNVVAADRGGNYRLKLPIKQKTQRKQVIYPTYAEGADLGPRGLENVVARLDSEDPEARKMQIALKTTVYEAMKNEAFGTETQRGIGWSGVAARLGERAGKLRLQVAKEKNPAIADIVKRQADGLDALAAELESSDGRTMPKVLAS